MRWGMLINLVKCVGCYRCVVKCEQEHFLPPDVLYAAILSGLIGDLAMRYLIQRCGLYSPQLITSIT
jgi:Fe-S-cluster-containing dehydrogenase component